MKTSEKKGNQKHLLNEASFALLTSLQREIEQAIGWQPSLHKLVNLFITSETCAQIKNQLMTELKQNNPF